MDKKRLAEVGMIECEDFYGKKVSVEKTIKHFEIIRDNYQEKVSHNRRMIKALKQYKTILEDN